MSPPEKENLFAGDDKLQQTPPSPRRRAPLSAPLEAEAPNSPQPRAPPADPRVSAAVASATMRAVSGLAPARGAAGRVPTNTTPFVRV